MKEKIIHKIIILARKAQALALKIGIPNLFQPGLVKELIIAEMLGHRKIIAKRGADACDKNNPSIMYEYLSCYEGGTGQLDRMFKEPIEKRAESLRRISRNRMIYLAIFYKNNPLEVKIIYEIRPLILSKEAENQLNRSGNKISHVGFSEDWAKKNSKVMYVDKNIQKH
ncbi:MAG: hypothetical protein COS25_00605 [Candidatus Nealsonbacteria bacterium CG02_land_8_20_14_3_00_37_10]|uniref:Uncharacterized protein n=1 Tax=Candidatus Nealsonbacteria bacterium CG02_land_8_20_14_3_00_37_10 TaxID=1974699 RepID=A0A2M7DA12_9BACT|nr:MAG: hypothetical protein COS25_00605 [Candidatus Nealsonbacteria bacterium CG02_land_8_20_14_3_00_37_10]